MRVVHCKKTSYTEYIGRPSSFGNPFAIGADGTREEVIEKYEAYARNNPSLLELIRDLPEDTVLGCWCYPKPCHGDVIIKLWEEMHTPQI
jgi:hypothetical protein